MGRPIKHWHKYRFDESMNKWVKKKRYKHPVITVVKLDPEQALLVACKSGGAYWMRNAGVTYCVYNYNSGSDHACNLGKNGSGRRHFSQRGGPSGQAS